MHKYAQPDEIYNGEIGTLHGVRFVETSEAKIWKGTGCPAGLAVFSTLILGATPTVPPRSRAAAWSTS